MVIWFYINLTYPHVSIPNNSTSYEEFISKMKDSEADFMSELSQLPRNRKSKSTAKSLIKDKAAINNTRNSNLVRRFSYARTVICSSGVASNTGSIISIQQPEVIIWVTSP